MWAVYNTLKFWTLYNLTDEEVSLLLMTFSDNELKLTKICKMNDSKWESALHASNSDFLKPDKKLKYSEAKNYPSLELRGDSGEDTGFFKTTAKVMHPRLHNRYEKRISCGILSGQNKEFSTQTIDLSEGGLYFKDIIPDWVAGYFIVTVNNEYALLCSLVEDQKEKTRVQIVADENDPQYTLYREWLLTL